MEIYSAFRDFPKEAQLVGRILSEYPEIEFELAQLVSKVIEDDDRAVRIIFRARGESRVTLTDAIVRPALNKVGLKNEYEATLGAVRYCKSVRNQYAHAHWINGNNELLFCDLEESASTAEGPTMVRFCAVDLALLAQQEKYMNYASHWLYFLMDHYAHRAGRSPIPAIAAPQIILPPSLSNPPKE